MKLDLKRTALVVTDPQVDFLSPTGVAWGVVSESVKEQNTVENIGRLFATAKKAGITVAISPHYYYPTDKGCGAGQPPRRRIQAQRLLDNHLGVREPR